MAFVHINKDVLQMVADEFGVEWTVENPKKEQMIKDIKDQGVTWSMYQKAFPDDQEEVFYGGKDKIVTEEDDDDEPLFDEDIEEFDEVVEEKSGAAERFSESKKTVLVKMTRANGTYQVRGYNFTREHPFLPVDEADVDFIIDVIGGFKIVSPKEAEEYYS